MASIFTDGSEKYSTLDSGFFIPNFDRLSLGENPRTVNFWPGGIVPYSISPTLRLYDDICKRINTAIITFNRQCRYVNWVDRLPSTHRDYVIFTENETTEAEIGYQGKEQYVYLASKNSQVGTILHEMCHAIGLVHEQSRLDRDHYVKVYDTKNINYAKSGIPIGRYDYDSIMHYPETPGVMVTHNPCVEIGQRRNLSYSDIKAIDYKYHPTGICSYDHFGDDYWPQEWVECYTCWGGESNFGCCFHCASTCHKGHHLIYHNDIRSIVKEKNIFVCDCGRNRHQSSVCTRHTTDIFVKQPFYNCYTCFSTPREGCCYQCMNHCHRGHNVVFHDISPAFCDCGFSRSCSVSCQIPKP